MLDSLISLFVIGGKSSLFSCSCMSSSIVLDDAFELPYVDSSLLTSSISTSSVIFSGCSSDNAIKNVESTSMIVESMSLDELYELRDLVDERGVSLKMHM